jgi:general L-amino acid transport system permease protein
MMDGRTTRRVVEPPPTEKIVVLKWLRDNLFDGWFNSTLTIGLIFILFITVPDLIQWAIVNAVWSTSDHEVCRAASGACWAVVGEKHRPMLFGVYPFEEHWRLVMALVIYVGVISATLTPMFWRVRYLAPLWVIGLISVATLMWGGVFGLQEVATDQWGGLPLTMVLFTGTVVFGFPLAIVLALGRQSSMPGIKSVCVVFIESLRGVPLITILFVAVNVFPLFLPEGVEFDKLMRVMVGMAVFFACYQAEVIRGGLQAVDRGQVEAAEALGLGYWHVTTRIVLPQALRICLPGIVNHIIAAFKNTSFVLIIGLFDILTATTAVMQDPVWRRFFIEAYLFVALLYFCFCFALSKYSQTVERWLSEGKRF